MGFYKSKPVIREAVEHRSDNLHEVVKFCPSAYLNTTHIDGVPGLELIIPTLEDGTRGQAKHVADMGDFIVKGVNGEFWAVKPDIFHLTYEAI